MKILFIHHGDHNGGAPLSMLYTMKEIRKRGFIPIVGLAIPGFEIRALYEKNGFQIIDMPFMRMLYYWSANPMQFWKPSTYLTILKIILNKHNCEKRFYKVIKKYNIDIVHLNSVSLITIVPFLLKNNLYYVWHIREHAPKSNSIIFYYVKKYMLLSQNLIFLSNAEKISWLGDSEHGTVVYNFVDIEKYIYNKANSEIKVELGINDYDRVLLYLGGIKLHKGILELVEALNILKLKYPTLKCIMLDSKLPVNKSANKNDIFTHFVKLLTKRKSLNEIVDTKLKKYELESICIRLPFDSDAQKYFYLSEVILFPATKPHFARPVIEAGLMKKPVIVTDWPVLREIVVDNLTGLFVKPNDYIDLSTKIDRILSDRSYSENLGINAYNFAVESFTADKQIHKIIAMYYGFNK